MTKRREPLVGLFCAKSVRAAERNTAVRGLERFRTFGVQCEPTTTEPTKEDMKLIKNPATVERILATPQGKPVTIGYNDLDANVWEMLFPRLMIPVVLIPQELLETSHENNGQARDTMKRRLALALKGRGGVVSLAKIRTLEDPKLAADTLAIAVVHTIGQILLGPNNCRNTNCVRHENNDFVDFVERFVRTKLDFCKRCAVEIGINAVRLKETSELAAARYR